MSVELLKQCIRLVDPEKDKDLPRFSHSKLEVYENCKVRYDLQYNQGKRTNDTSLALEIGTLCHKVLEEKGKMIVAQKPIDYDKLNDLLDNGCEETDEKTKEIIKGVKDLKKGYFEEWYNADNASGMNYDEKLIKFNEVLHSEMQVDDWVPVYFELPFEFVWKICFRWGDSGGFSDTAAKRSPNVGKSRFLCVWIAGWRMILRSSEISPNKRCYS